MTQSKAVFAAARRTVEYVTAKQNLLHTGKSLFAATAEYAQA